MQVVHVNRPVRAMRRLSMATLANAAYDAGWIIYKRGQGKDGLLCDLPKVALNHMYWSLYNRGLLG